MRPSTSWRRRAGGLAAILLLGGLAGAGAGWLLGERAPEPQERAALSDAPAPTPQPSANPEPAPEPAARPTGPAAEPVQPALRRDAAHPDAPPAAASRDAPAWRRYAAAVPADAADKPRLAIVLDDLGPDKAAAAEAIALPAPLTLAFLTYADGLPDLTRRARAAGHELLAHVPMQPSRPDANPGPKALSAGLPEGELMARLAWGLARVAGAVGINNHMGSRFTQDRAGMRQVLGELRRRGLLFLDSRTIAATLGAEIAGELGVPVAERDVFLDNDRDPAAIRRQLDKAAEMARAHGAAIAIGHPYDSTLQVLAERLPQLADAGIALVPVSALVQVGGARPDLAELAE
jgi:hypothetical protein